MSRPIDRYNATELFALADKLDKQGLFAAIDIQDSTKDGDTAVNGSKVAKLNDVVADSIRFIAECKEQAESIMKQLLPDTPPQVGME